jgi:hypothetical protein
MAPGLVNPEMNKPQLIDGALRFLISVLST